MSAPTGNKTSGQFISIQKLHVAKMLTDVAGTGATYETPIDFGKVLRQVDISPSNSSVDAYADGQTIDTATNTASYELTFETAALPLEYLAYLLGHAYEDGKMTANKDDVAPYFALMFQSDKRNGKKRLVKFYKVQFSEPNSTSKTKEENIEFQMPTITAKAIYRLADGNSYVYADDEENSSINAANWYASVDEVSGGGDGDGDGGDNNGGGEEE